MAQKKLSNVLITGTSTGIGKSVAAYLSSSGYKVLGTSRNPKANRDDMLSLDVTDENSSKTCVEAAYQKLGSIDVLVNNAGFGLAGPIETTSVEAAQKQFDTNYFGVLRMMQAVIPKMKENGGGLIINVSSIAALIGLPFQAHYSASKYALEGLLEAARVELKPFNIKVVNVNPGDFKTAFSVKRQKPEQVPGDYKEASNKFVSMYEREEGNGADPILIAKLIERLIETNGGKKPRYLVGYSSQKFGVKLKKIIGDRLFEKVMQKFWA